MNQEPDVHTGHCCVLHGCKYSNDDCPVEKHVKRQEHPCEACSWKTERDQNISPTEIVWGLDFLKTFPCLTLDDIPEVLQRAKGMLWFNFSDVRLAKGGWKAVLDCERDYKGTVPFTDEMRRLTQLHACALRYAEWVYDHMFVPNHWRFDGEKG